MALHRHGFTRFFALVSGVAALLLGLQLYAHRTAPFLPEYQRLDLTALLSKPALEQADYETLLLQTGLGPAAVDTLFISGDTAFLIEAQAAFFHPPAQQCDSLAAIVREDHFLDASGNLAYGFPLAPAEDGDVFLSFSTHTLSWRHGHAGVVADAERGLTLEAAVIGSNSAQADLSHWRRYTTFLHLRVKDITPEQQRRIAAYCLDTLDGIPYRLTSGLFGEKHTPADCDCLGAQCAYLVWYALMAAGFDTDGDGGRLVTVADLAQSPLFEVVQVYGIDPRLFLH